MASPSDISRLRLLTSEALPGSEYTDEVMGGYIDSFGLYGAAVEVWTHKAADWAELVNTSEGDARRDMSDLLDHAERMIAKYQTLASIEARPSVTRVHKIVRS